MTGNNDAEWEKIRQVLSENPDDRDAWCQLFERVWPFAVAVAVHALGACDASAEDAAQECLRKLFQSPPFATLKSGSHLRRHVARVTVNCAIDARRQARIAESPLHSRRMTQMAAPPEEEIAREEERMARHRCFETFLSALSTTDRQIAQMSVHAHSLGEIAAEVGLTYGATGVRLHRIRTKLRKCYQDNGLTW
jgi:RNA polymerase sigma factor (sigma-70 family)